MSRSVLILAGGRSRRLGRDKPRVRVGGTPVIARVLDAAVEGAGDDADVLLSVRDLPSAGGLLEGHTLADRVRLVPDPEPGLGPVAGLAALTRARGDVVAVLSGDMPFLTGDLVGALLDALDGSGADAVIPLVDGRAQRLCAAYRSTVGEVAARLLHEVAGGARGPRVQDALDRVSVRYIDRVGPYEQDELRILCRGIDSPEDLDWARARAGKD